MKETELSSEELATLAQFEQKPPHLDIDPNHFAKLISLGLLEQQMGGTVVSGAGRAALAGTDDKSGPTER